MPSYDISCKANAVEVKNAVEQAQKELATRFDFKGTRASIEKSTKGTATELVLIAESDFQLQQLRDILNAKLSKRGIDLRYLQIPDPEKRAGDTIRLVITVKEGIDTVVAKKIVQHLKQSAIKVQASIQGDIVRVSGAKRDDLQNSIQLIKKDITELPLDMDNFRD